MRTILFFLLMFGAFAVQSQNPVDSIPSPAPPPVMYAGGGYVYPTTAVPASGQATASQAAVVKPPTIQDQTKGAKDTGRRIQIVENGTAFPIYVDNLTGETFLVIRSRSGKGYKRVYIDTE